MATVASLAITMGGPAFAGETTKREPAATVGSAGAMPPLPTANPNRVDAGKSQRMSEPAPAGSQSVAPKSAAPKSSSAVSAQGTKDHTGTAKPEDRKADARDNASPVQAKDDKAAATPKEGAGTAAASPAPLAKVEPPKPKTPEDTYLAKLDGLIAPVRDLAISDEDAKHLKEIAKPGAVAAAIAAKGEIKDSSARKLAEWLLLRGGVGEISAYQAFLADSEGWPQRWLLVRRVEEKLLSGGGSTAEIKAHFGKFRPETGAGWAALASAHLIDGEEDKAKAAAVKAWREYDLPPSLETGFLERFEKLLSPADHRRRLDRILVDEVRFQSQRNERATRARRLLPRLSDEEKKKAEARIAVLLRSRTATKLLAALPAQKEGEPVDWGLAYQRVQHMRRTGNMEGAWKLLLSAPADEESLISPDDWWVERRAAAQAALKAGKHQLAYDLAKEAGPLSENPLKDQTFLAGWIALRHLKKPGVALKHFEASRKAADGPLSRARGDYWWGRALEAMGRKDEARKRYAQAAKEDDTFHGLLSLQKLDPSGPLALPIKLPKMPSAEEVATFNARDAVRALVLVAKLDLDPQIRRAFFGQLRYFLTNEAEMAMLAHLGRALGDVQSSLRVAKLGIGRGMNLAIYGYPMHTFPDYEPLREPPEKAFLLGIARQETEFNPTIISSAGARGLLQVMPITARHICRDYKIKCEIPRLMTDHAYNAQIASAYIADRMREVRGSYVLGLVSYNAGPGRARQWIRELGDPRAAGADPIDWIETIPIEETRLYVEKVLSNIQVYRARLGEKTPLRLMQDLARAQ